MQRDNQPIVPQPAQKGRGMPMSVRHRGNQPLAARRTAERARHVGRGPALIDKDQLGGVEFWDQLGPCGACLGDIGAVLFGRTQPFF